MPRPSPNGKCLFLLSNETTSVYTDFFVTYPIVLSALLDRQWEVLAEVMADAAEQEVAQHEHEYTEEDYEHAKKIAMPVLIAKIDCVDHKELCQQEGIRAYPSLILFINGERWHGGAYRGSRTVVELTDWLRQVEDSYMEENPDAPRSIGDAHEGRFRFCALNVDAGICNVSRLLFRNSCQGSHGPYRGVRRRT